MASVPLSSMPLDPEAEHFEAKPWEAAATHYTETVGPSSALAAPHMVALASSLVPLGGRDSGSRILELGAGTGSLTFAIVAAAPTAPLLATDISSEMLNQLRANAVKAGVGVIPTQILDMTAPITPATPEGAFSHVFCFMALQNLPEPLPSIREWLRLLRPGGVLAVGVWDFDQPTGPHDIWLKAARKVVAGHVDTTMLPPGRWNGLVDLEKGLRGIGLRDVKAQPCQVGFNVGSEGFMHFFWESRSPMPVAYRKGRSEDEIEKLKAAMLDILKDEYDDGKNIPLWTGLVAGIKRAV